MLLPKGDNVRTTIRVHYIFLTLFYFVCSKPRGYLFPRIVSG